MISVCQFTIMSITFVERSQQIKIERYIFLYIPIAKQPILSPFLASPKDQTKNPVDSLASHLKCKDNKSIGFLVYAMVVEMTWGQNQH